MSPTTQLPNNKRLFGFDIETYDKNKKFLLASVYDGKEFFRFSEKQDLINFFKTKRFYNSYVCATNLGFDYFGTFFGSDDAKHFNLLFRGSSLLSASAFIKNKNEFSKKQVGGGGKSITFIDTMNYCMMSVDKLGSILGIKKMKESVKDFIGEVPRTNEEWETMWKYNERDSEISYKAIEFFYDSFYRLGATPKKTIASTSMSLFRNKYLSESYYRHPQDILLNIFDGYYGGNTHAYKRGLIENYNYYDFNCFSSDTEILTDNGWKYIDRLSYTDKVFSMDNDKLVKQDIRKIINNQYKGEMVRLKNENTDQLVTPNHRVYYKDFIRSKLSIQKKGWTDWKVKEAGKLAKTYIKFPNAFPYDGTHYMDNNILKLSAWFITEGHKKYNTVEISQSIDENMQYCNEIVDILNSLGIWYRSVIREQKGKKYLYIYFKWDILEDLFEGDHFRSHNKVLPKGFIELPTISKKILFDELMKGDGSINKKGKATYVSCSFRLLDEFQILSTMIGYKCSINYKHNVCNIKLNRNGESQIKLKNGNTTELYEGRVWCVSVDKKNIVVRRNGKVFISGNSLYPSVMLNEFPDPNTFRKTYQNTTEYIDSYDGISKVDVYCPPMDYPLLPFRYDNKLIMPTGTFTGWWTHIELKRAKQLGYIIKRVHQSIYYKKNCIPMRNYVLDLYDLRLQYQKENNPMELVVKLFMNSLYGKFGQKFLDKDNLTYMNHSLKQLEKYKSFERIGDFIRLVQDAKPSVFCIPIWASYVTAYGRIKLHDTITDCDPVYCDTDSVITKKKYASRTDIGKLKLEMKIKRGIIVKPKCYFIKNNETSHVKIKGLGIKLKESQFYAFLHNPTKTYDRFIKIKESLRRKLIPNEIVEITKSYDLEDTKRTWEKPFNFNELQYSTPIELQNGKIKNEDLNIVSTYPQTV